MDISAEKNLVRELAKRYAEIAANEANAERKARIIDNNSLTPGRPVVWIDEVPWHEMNFDGSLTIQCERPEFAEVERFFRIMLFRWKNMQADMVAEDAYYVHKAYKTTGIGVSVVEDTVATDTKNHIISHRYDDQLDTEEKAERLRLPVVTAHPEADAKKLEFAGSLIGDIFSLLGGIVKGRRKITLRSQTPVLTIGQ